MNNLVRGWVGLSVLGWVGLIAPTLARSHEISSETSAGSSTVAEALTYAGGSPRWDWTLGYTLLRSASTDAVTGAEVLSRTHDFSGGLGWKVNRDWQLGGGYVWGIAQDENLTDHGPSFYAAYTLQKSPASQSDEGDDDGEDDREDDREDSPFSPSLRLKAGASLLRYSVSTPKVRRLASPASDIQQIQFSLDVGLNWIRWNSLGLGANFYRYNRDAGTFTGNLARLGSLGVVGARFAGLSDAVASFLDVSLDASTTFHVTDDLDLGFTVVWSRSASEGASSRSFKLDADYDLSDHWRLGVGAELDSVETGTNGLGILKLAFLF